MDPVALSEGQPIILGEPADSLVVGLRDVGLAIIARDRETTIWGEASMAAPALTTAWDEVIRRKSEVALLTIEEAADALDIAALDVYKLIGQGQLSTVQLSTEARVVVCPSQGGDLPKPPCRTVRERPI